ncbi:MULTISPECIES: amidohydrolase [unclassified Nocardia]|uniref:amidohydrolase n=1 Tax=unclassified Nocardia TaxID=2637762 RepID=UPI001CE4616E|nr:MULTISPECIES: amidohydrolase [unclassified Nocardia]
MNRRQALRLAGTAAAATAAAGLIASCSAPASRRTPTEPILLHNVNGVTCTSQGNRRFASLLIGADGKIEALDPGAVGGVRRVDGRGRVCVPGLHDSHGHVFNLGALSTQLDLSPARSLNDALQMVDTYTRAHPTLSWITGRGWNEVNWHDRLPTAADLDTVVDGRPVWLLRTDSHMGWANSAALRATAVMAATPDPAGGTILRDEQGHPTGILIDTAKRLVDQQIPAPTTTEHTERLLAAQRMLNQVGLTGVTEAATGPEHVPVLFDCARTDQLTMRINSCLTWEAFTRFGDAVRRSTDDDRLRVGTVKIFVDGALGSHGACLLAPYADQPGNRGLAQLSFDELAARIRRAADAGFAVAVHAIGDAANRMALDAFAQVGGSAAHAPLRHRIEHAQVLDLTDIPRFAQLGLIASMQPMHAVDDRAMAEARLGADRLAGAYAWRRFAEQRTVLAAGSDFPVATHNPWDGLHAATTRTDREGAPAGGWRAEQALSPAEALRAYTLDAAYAAGQEHLFGSLEPGKYADLVLCDQDPLAVPAGRALWQTKVLQTWVGGIQVGEYDQL